MVQRLGLAGHKNASYALLAQLGLLALHFVLESAIQKIAWKGCAPAFGMLPFVYSKKS